MNIPASHSTPASSAVSFPFPAFLRVRFSSLSSLLSSSAPSAVRFPYRLIAIRIATLAVFAAIVATFATTWRWQTRQTRLKSGPESGRHQIRIEKRQKRQCSPRRSTLACVTAAPRRISRPHSPLGVARSSTSCRNVTAHADHCGRIRLSDPAAPPDAGARETSPAAKSHNAWDARTTTSRGARNSRAGQPQLVSVRCSPNGCRPGYYLLISPGGYHQSCAARLACAISTVLCALLCHCKSRWRCYSPVATHQGRLFQPLHDVYPW